MKRWPLMLLVILLLTSALVFLTGRSALLLAPILWLLGNKVIHSVSKERPFKASVRFVIASFAAVGCSVVVEATRALRFFRMQEFGAGGPISIIAPCCLVIYWLEDSYALMALQGVAQTIVRAVVSLILSSFAAIGLGYAYAVAYFWAHPTYSPVSVTWTAWGFLFLGIVLPFYSTWKLLPQSERG